MLNGDVLTDIDLTAELAQHERRGAARDARAVRGRGHLELRRGAHRRRRRRRGVHREGRRRAAHEPDQRGRVRDRARRRGDVDSRRPRGLVRARGVPVARRGTACTATTAAGYWIDIGTPGALPRGDLGPAGRAAWHSTLPPRDETGSLVYENCLAVGRARGAAERARAPLLGRHRRARGALGAARPRARGRRRDDRESRCSPSACAWASGRRSGPRRHGGGGGRDRRRTPWSTPARAWSRGRPSAVA